MAKGLFIANIIGTLPELGTDVATKNWGDFAATLVEDVAQGALLYVETKGSEKAKELLENAKTEILEVALLVVESMNILNGFGQEDEGGSFKTARAYFGTADVALKNAIPDDHWQGSAAEAYKAENEKQRTRLQSLEELDSKMQEILERQAGMVEDTRNFLGIWKGVITASVFIAIALYAYAGPQASIGYQVLVAFASIAAVTSKELLTAMAATSIGHEVDGLQDKYQEIADAAKLSSDGSDKPSVKAGMPKAVETKISSFEALSDSTSGSTALPDGLAGALVDPGGQGAPQSAPTGESEIFAGATPGETLGETSLATTPTVAQLAVVSGQTAKLPGHTSQHQASAVPAGNASDDEAALVGAVPTEAALADTVEGAGSGSEGAERAPIEVAVGVEQAQVPPSPLQHNG